MKNLKTTGTLIAMVWVFLSSTLTAQISAKELTTAWDNMTSMVVETAKAMPSEHYTYKPTTELRDFASQIGHTTGANYLFASVVKLERPKKMPTTKSKNKAKVVQELQDSFAFIRTGMSKLTPADLNENIEFFGRKMSRMQSILIMTSHLQREHGKTTIYTRLKKTAPGKTKGW